MRSVSAFVMVVTLMFLAWVLAHRPPPASKGPELEALVVGDGPRGEAKFPPATVEALLPCMADAIVCPKLEVAVRYKGVTSRLPAREAAWLVVVECLHDPGSCQEPAALGAFVAQVQAALNPGPEVVTPATGPRPAALAMAARAPSDFIHPNGPLTHGVGLQPWEADFPYPQGLKFPLTDPQRLISSLGVDAGYEVAKCTPIPGAGAEGPWTCDLGATPDGTVVCPPVNVSPKKVTVMRGEWHSQDGFWPNLEFLTLSCGAREADPTEMGALAKCRDVWKFCPPKGLDPFSACVRAVTAQYCGMDHSDTHTGIPINVYTDRLKGDVYSDPPGGALCPYCDDAKMYLEAGWNARRATMVSKTRLKHSNFQKYGCPNDYNGGDDGDSDHQKVPGGTAILFTRARVYTGGPGKVSDPDCRPRQGHPLPTCSQAPACP